MFDPSFDELESIACGEMNLDINYFYNLTPRQFFNISTGFAKQQKQQMQLSWEQTRSIMYMINLSIPTKNKKKESIQQFMPFTWEKNIDDNVRMSKSDKDKMFARWDKLKFDK